MKLPVLLVSIFACMAFHAAGQQVGINTQVPSALLHVKDGDLKLENTLSNNYVDLSITTPYITGFRFLNNGIFKGAWFYNSSSASLNLTNSVFVNGMVYQLNTNRLFLGRNAPVDTTERFGIRFPLNTATRGGMYIETYGNAAAKPFYGYAVDSIAKAWHYYDAADAKWKLNVSGDRLVVKDNGFTGIGTTDPLDRLHVFGTIRIDGGNPLLRWMDGATTRAYIQHNTPALLIYNVQNGPMYFATNNATRVTIADAGNVGIGNTTPASKLHVAGTVRIDHASAPELAFYKGASGSGRIQFTGNDFTMTNLLAGNLAFITSDLTRLSIAANGDISADAGSLFVHAGTNRVGIGQMIPEDKLHITGGNLRIDNSAPQLSFYQGATQTASIQTALQNLSISNSGTGQLQLRTNNTTQLSVANNGDIAMDVNTFFLNAANNRIGIGQSVPVDKLHLTGGNLRIENTTAQLNFYQGATFGAFIQSTNPNLIISNKNSGELQLRTNDVRRLAVTNAGDVVIGTILPATGYRLSVDGKVMCEELKVQMSDLWPDYVFAENYPLMTIDALRAYIGEHQHLPGIPSASEVNSMNGVELGEMNRLLLEKVEELTLYMISLQEQIDAMKSK